jgi:hypothetical protein
MNVILSWTIWAISVCGPPCTPSTPGVTTVLTVTPAVATCNLTGPAGFQGSTGQDPMTVTWDDPLNAGKVCSTSVAAIVSPLAQGQYYFALTTTLGPDAATRAVILGPHVSPVFGRLQAPPPIASTPGALRIGP